VLIQPKFHQTIETSVVDQVHVRLEFLSDEVSSFDFVRFDTGPAPKELEVIMEE
jgi:hypothetical protein